MRVSGYNIILLILLITISGISQEIKYPPGSSGGGGGNNFNPNQFETNNLQVTVKSNAGITNLNVYNNLDVKGTVYLRGNQTNIGLFVNTNGYVGIGTTNPAYILHTTASAAFSSVVLGDKNGYGNMYGYNGSSLSYRDGLNNVLIGLLVKSTNGYVSINSLNPKSRLDVHGNIGTGGAGIEYPENFTNAIVLTNTIGLSATAQLTNTVAIYATNGWLVARSPQNQGIDSHLIGWADMQGFNWSETTTNYLSFPTYGKFRIDVSGYIAGGESMYTPALIYIAYGVTDDIIYGTERQLKHHQYGGDTSAFPLHTCATVDVQNEIQRLDYYKIIFNKGDASYMTGNIIIQRIR